LASAVGPFAALGLWVQMLLNKKSNRKLSHMRIFGETALS